MCGVAILLSSYVFTMSDQVEGLNSLVIMAIVLVNVVFLMQLLYLLSKSFQEKYRIAMLFAQVLEFVLCIKKIKKNEKKEVKRKPKEKEEAKEEQLQITKVRVLPKKKSSKKHTNPKRPPRQKFTKSNLKLPKITLPKKQWNPKPWDSFSSSPEFIPPINPSPTSFHPKLSPHPNPTAVHLNSDLNSDLSPKS